MRLFLALLPGVLALAAGCYGANTDPDPDEGSGGPGGASNSGGGQTSGGRSSGSGGSPSAGSEAGGNSSAGTDTAGSSSAGMGTAGTSCGPYCNEVVCEGANSTYAGVIKSCGAVGDCMLVEHMADCCGSILIMGINTDPGALELFERAEAQCTAGQPICDCVPLTTGLEDGTAIALDDPNYAVACVEGQCQSVYAGETFACGDINCTDAQYCTLIAGGEPGSGTSASCSLLEGCQNCDCLPASAGCGCSQDDVGFITVSCAAP